MSQSKSKQQNPQQCRDKSSEETVWSTPIFCNVAFVGSYSDDFAPKNFTRQDIVSYLKCPWRRLKPGGRLYFDPSLYPTGEDKVTKESFSLLAANLGSSAKAGGFELIRNGKTKTGATRFKCSCVRVCTSQAIQNPLERKRKLRSNTGVTKRPSKPCQFGFHVHNDKYGFYIKTNFGTPIHRNHDWKHPSSFTQLKKPIPKLRERLMPLIEELISLHESPNVDTSVVPPIEPLLASLKAEITCLKSTLVEDPKSTEEGQKHQSALESSNQRHT